MADNTAGNTIVSLFGEDRAKAPQPRPIDLAHEGDIALGPLTARPSLRQVEGPKGEVTLEPKVMQVLVALAREPGTILSREDLIERCWDGRIVGDASINRVLSLLRAALRSVAGEQVSIDTVPRVGYRLLVPEGSSIADKAIEGDGLASAGLLVARLPVWLVGVLLLGALLIAAAVWTRSDQAIEPVSIAMLPLVDQQAEDPFFAAGLETALRSEFARGTNVVISSGETGEQLLALDLPREELARRIDEDYVLFGRVERVADRITFEAQLIAGEDGRLVHSETFASVTGAAETLPERVARAFLQEIGRAPEAASAAIAMAPDDYALFLTATGLIRARAPGQMKAANKILASLSETYPSSSQIWSARAKGNFLLATSIGSDAASRKDDARVFANRALELDPDSTDALKVMGMIASGGAERFAFIEKATDIDPGDSEAWLWMSHIAAHPDYTDYEVEAMRRLVELDPLWGRSWQASNVVAGSKGVEVGSRLENLIIAASVEPWQADLARARVANMRGDISRLYAATISAAPSMTPEQADIANLQLANMMLLVGLEMPQRAEFPGTSVIAKTMAGRLPTKEEFEAVRLGGKDFWRIVPLVIAGPSLFIKEGRVDELLASYDAMFSSPQDLVDFSEQDLRAYHYRTNVATYVGLAMREAGRDREARELLDLAERSVARWRANDAMHMTPLLFEANLAAVNGQKRRALDALGRMIELGYPYILQSPGVALTGPLLDDPAWDRLRADPELRSMLAPIRANLARERRQIEEMRGAGNT